MNNRFEKSIKNIVWGLSGQVLVLILGLIVPRLILVNYGSEINGLTNTVSQIYTYVALLEAGIGQSALFALFRAKDNTTISKILAATRIEYHKIGWIFLACSISISICLPLVIRSELSYFVILVIAFLAAIPSLVSFFSVSAYLQLLVVDGKSYVQSNIGVVITVVSSITKIILANLCVNIVLLQVAFCIINCLKSLLFYVYFKRHYSWIDKKVEPAQGTFVDRIGYLKSQLAWIVFSNTDVLFISIFLDLKAASVYAIYNLVYSAIYILLNQLYSSVCFLLGYEYNKSLDEYKDMHDSFDAFFDMLICATMSICYIFIIPFIQLYTKGINDTEYINNLYPMLFCTVQILTWIRYASGNLSSLAGYAKKIGNISLIEAVINIVCTIVFIKLWGISGALLGTIVALLFKSNYLIIFVNRNVLYRNCKKSFRICISNVLLFGVISYCGKFLKIVINNYFEFFEKAILASLIVYSFFFIFNLIVNNKETMYYVNILLKKINLMRKKESM